MTEWWPGGAWAIFMALNCRKDFPSVTRHSNICLQKPIANAFMYKGG